MKFLKKSKKKTNLLLDFDVDWWKIHVKIF